MCIIEVSDTNARAHQWLLGRYISTLTSWSAESLQHECRQLLGPYFDGLCVLRCPHQARPSHQGRSQQLLRTVPREEGWIVSLQITAHANRENLL